MKQPFGLFRFYALNKKILKWRSHRINHVNVQYTFRISKINSIFLLPAKTLKILKSFFCYVNLFLVSELKF